MKLTPDEVKKIATLARLSLGLDEVTRFQTQLSDVLTYMEQLNEVDTAGVAITAQVTGLENVLRDDAAVDSVSQQRLIEGTPGHDGRSIKVKEVFKA